EIYTTSSESTSKNSSEPSAYSISSSSAPQLNFEEVIPPPIDKREHVSLNKKEIINMKKCPECGNTIQVAEGCMLCLSCGFSVCSV
ncbi:MAG: hypothetical protein AAB953_00890, partial [Patescibacteria group bacterium]